MHKHWISLTSFIKLHIKFIFFSISILIFFITWSTWIWCWWKITITLIKKNKNIIKIETHLIWLNLKIRLRGHFAVLLNVVRGSRSTQCSQQRNKQCECIWTRPECVCWSTISPRLTEFTLKIREVIKRFESLLTVDNFSISSSDAPNEAKPISCENCAKLGSANNGICPNNSWMQSLLEKRKRYKINIILMLIPKRNGCSKDNRKQSYLLSTFKPIMISLKAGEVKEWRNKNHFPRTIRNSIQLKINFPSFSGTVNRRLASDSIESKCRQIN